MNLEGRNERRRWAPARFHSHIIRVRRPRPLNEHTCTRTHTHTTQHSGPGKDEQGQSPCCNLMRGDRWEETLQTLAIKLTFLGSVCVFLCMCTHVFLNHNQIIHDRCCTHTHTHTHTIPSMWPSGTSWQAGVKAVGAELSGQQKMVLSYLLALPGIINDCSLQVTQHTHTHTHTPLQLCLYYWWRYCWCQMFCSGIQWSPT